MNENGFVRSVNYEGNIMTRVIRVKKDRRQWAGEGLNILRGRGRTGKVGDTSTMATPLVKVLLGEQSIVYILF